MWNLNCPGGRRYEEEYKKGVKIIKSDASFSGFFWGLFNNHEVDVWYGK